MGILLIPKSTPIPVCSSSANWVTFELELQFGVGCIKQGKDISEGGNTINRGLQMTKYEAPQGMSDKASPCRGMTDEALKLAWGQTGKSLKGHAKLLF